MEKMQPDLTLIEEPFFGPLAKRLGASRIASDIVLHWLGQAGFILEYGGQRLLIDPYLSDTLENKYRGTATPHERMMASPISPDALGPI